MSSRLETGRARATLAIVLILLPLAITAAVKYLPALTRRQHISSVAILHPRIIGPKDFIDENDVAKRLRDSLGETPELKTRDLPLQNSTMRMADLAREAASAGADALILPTLTVDAGSVQLDLQVIETQTSRVIFNTPFESSIDKYPDMMKAAGAVLKRALQH